MTNQSASSGNRSWSQESYLRASRFAAQAHRGQTVPGSDGLPYLLHVTQVAMEVVAAPAAEATDDPDFAVQCALLRDVLEDTDVDATEFVEAFGPDVAAGVRALSKDKAISKTKRMADSLARIREQPREVWLVKLADRITNLQPPPAHWSPEKRATYLAEAEMILASLGEASQVLGNRLRARIQDYRRFLRG